MIGIVITINCTTGCITKKSMLYNVDIKSLSITNGPHPDTRVSSLPDEALLAIDEGPLPTTIDLTTAICM